MRRPPQRGPTLRLPGSVSGSRKLVPTLAGVALVHFNFVRRKI
jgi:hypothetical protein